MFSPTKNKKFIGNLRYKADIRQFGGLTFAVASLITMNSLTDIAAMSGGGGNTPTSGLALYNLVGACLLCLIGTVGMFLGYGVLVNDQNNRLFTGFTIVITQFAWVPFIGGLTSVGLAARDCDPSKPSFIPAALNPTCSDVKFVGAMGIMAIMSYAAAFVGSLGFMQFAIFSYQSGMALDRSAPYFRGRALYYNCVLLLAGLSQFLLGCFALSKYGGGPYSEPIVVSLYTVFYPEITVYVGLVQMVVGTTGAARRFGRLGGERGVPAFQFMCGFMWIMMLVLQNLVQIGYGVGGSLVARAPTLGCFYLPLALMPAYLDYKMNTVPEHLPPGYYVVESKDAVEDEEAVGEEAA